MCLFLYAYILQFGFLFVETCVIYKMTAGIQSKAIVLSLASRTRTHNVNSVHLQKNPDTEIYSCYNKYSFVDAFC